MNKKMIKLVSFKKDMTKEQISQFDAEIEADRRAKEEIEALEDLYARLEVDEE